MNTLKIRPALCAGLCLFLLGGCSQNGQDLEAAVDKLFSAYNHLCEADSLSAKGSIDAQGIFATYTAAYTSDPQQLAINATLGQGDGKPVSFYIKDGKTYLNYMGTKSSSVAENIGIKPEDGFHLSNPFLELSRKERADLFESVEVKDDTYTFTVKNSTAEEVLDDFGAADVKKCVIKAVIDDDQIKNIYFQLDGALAVGSSATDVSLEATAEILSVDKPVDIEFPADLDTWQTEAR